MEEDVLRYSSFDADAGDCALQLRVVPGGRGVGVAAHEPEVAGEPIPSGRGEAGASGNGLLHLLAEDVGCPIPGRDSDDDELRRKQPLAEQLIQGGQKLTAGEVAR